MFARLLALAVAAAFSLTAFAGEPVIAPQVDKSEALIKQLVSCGEVKAAKHLSLAVVMAIGAAFSSKIQEDLKPYEAAMDSAKSCTDLDAAYTLIESVFQKNAGTNAEEYFNSPEGKVQLEQLVVELKKIK